MKKRGVSGPPASGPAAYAGALVLYLLLLAAARFDPLSAWWGLNLHAFLPAGVTILLLGASLLVLVPPFRAAAGKLAQGISRLLFPERPAVLRTGIAAAAILTMFFWFCAMPFPTLGGDGVHILRRLFRYNAGAMSGFGQMWTEPLTVLCYTALTKMTAAMPPGGGSIQIGGYAMVFRAVAAILGGGFILLLLRFAREIFERPEERTSMAVSLLGCAGSIFFFGYVEFYTPLYFFGTGFILAGIAESNAARFPARATIFLILALLFHLSAVTFLPAWLFLLAQWLRRKKGAGGFRWQSVAAAAAILLLCAFLFYLWFDASGHNGFFIPLFGKGRPWFLFSGRHLADILNNLFLDAPFALLIGSTLILRREKMEPPDARILFASLCALFWFSLLVSHSGVAHDWDVYPLLGVSLAALAVLLISRVRRKGAREYLTAQASIQPLLFLLPWILVQTSFSSAVDRYAAVTRSYARVLPPEVISGYYETLRTAFSVAGNKELEVAAIMEAIDFSQSPYEYYKLTRAIETAPALTPPMQGAVDEALRRYHAASDSVKLLPVGEDSASRGMHLPEVAVNLVKATERLMPPGRALPWLEEKAKIFLEERRRVFDMASFIGHRYFDEKDFPKAEEWYLRALGDTAGARVAKSRALPFVLNRLAIVYAKTGREEESIRAFRLAVAHPRATALTWSDYGFACFTYGRFEEARVACSECLKRDSTDVNALYCLGSIEIRDARMHAGGVYLLGKFMALEPDSRRAQQVRTLLGDQ